MSLYDDFLALGYTENEAKQLVCLADNCDRFAHDVDIDEISEAIIDEFDDDERNYQDAIDGDI